MDQMQIVYFVYFVVYSAFYFKQKNILHLPDNMKNKIQIYTKDVPLMICVEVHFETLM